MLHALLPGSSSGAVRNTVGWSDVGCSDALCVLQDYQRLLSTQPPRRLNTAKLAESSALKVGALTFHTACQTLPQAQHGLYLAQAHLLLRAKALCQAKRPHVFPVAQASWIPHEHAEEPTSCMLLHLQSLIAVLHLLSLHPPLDCEAAAV